MYLISISFDEKKVPDHFRDIHNQKCLKHYIDGDFLVVTDTNEILHYYRTDIIVAFHIEYLGLSFEEVHNEE